jgi:transcriptional regulator with XRE-family HTH domain
MAINGSDMKGFNSEKFGMHLASLRRGNKMSLRELAEKLGVSAPTISRIERGGNPDIDTFCKICRWAEWEKKCHKFFH